MCNNDNCHPFFPAHILQKLQDLKVVGTMGLTDDDIQALKELPETDTVEGAYSTDVICGETDSQKVLHVESLNKEVNHPGPRYRRSI